MKGVKKTMCDIKYISDFNPVLLRNVIENNKNGVDYKVLARMDKETSINIEKWKPYIKNMKPIPNKGVAMQITDNKELMIILIKSNVTLLIRDKAFISMLKMFFLKYYEDV